MKDVVSVEKVLNSRCSCDFDSNPKKNHWGMFVRDKPPSESTLQRILGYCKIPQFSGGKLLLWFEDEYLFLGFEKENDPVRNRFLHVESGMQQEAVYLTCTARGLGTCIQNLGINGTEYGDKIATTRHIILEKANSYGTEKFSTAIPGPEKMLKKSKNLSEPKRDGDKECLEIMEQLTLVGRTGSHSDEAAISQLLWAAKGRTPHYIKSHPWGLTIPTMGGGQNYTDVYLLKGNRLYKYVNWTSEFFLSWWTTRAWWTTGNPVHDISFAKNLKVSYGLENAQVAIILSRNEKTNRALWEVGYMLENLLLQAKSLDISFKAKIFTETETNALERNRISEAVAALLL